MGTTTLRVLLLCCFAISSYAQKIDANFGRNGLITFKELGMESSQIIDFDIVEEDKLQVLYESEADRHFVKLDQKGKKQFVFDIDSTYVGNYDNTPVDMVTKSDGSVLVLSSIWEEENSIVAINQFNWDGTIDTFFGEEGAYKQKITEGEEDNNYGQQIHVSTDGSVMVVAKVSQVEEFEEVEKMAVLKVSDIGETMSTHVYPQTNFVLNATTMVDDHLLMGYAETINDGEPNLAHLERIDSQQMLQRKLDVRKLDASYQSTDQLVVANDKIYASHIQDDEKIVYTIRKYDVNGIKDTAFKGEISMSTSADIYTSNFIVSERGDILIVSTNLDNAQHVLIQKLFKDGSVDTTFGKKGIASLKLKYPVEDITKIRLDDNQGLYISGNMEIMGSSYGFITRVKLNFQKLEGEQLEEFINELFTED